MNEEKIYIGCKIIKAVPMSKNEFEESKGNTIINQDNVDGYKVTYPDRYVSWSPKNVFENAYREILDSEKELLG